MRARQLGDHPIRLVPRSAIVRIDPHAWLITLPLTVALIQLYFQPTNHIVKRWWSDLSRWEVQTWGRFSPLSWTGEVDRPSRRKHALYAALVLSLATCSVA